MSDFEKNECYKFYNNYSHLLNWRNIPKEAVEDFLNKTGIQGERFANNMANIEYMYSWPKKIETFGIELEYAGRDNACNRNHELTEDLKYDGSVAGDGREWNLKPQKISDITSEKYQKSLESWMVTASNHGCLIHASAGNHIHFGRSSTIDEYMETLEYDDEDGPDSEVMCSIGDSVRHAFVFCFKDGTIYDTENNTLTWGDKIRLTKTLNEETCLYTKKYYEALQFLYSVSNRSGNEDYGLGSDGTRGYTRHATVEIRVFRTTTDYRSVIARVLVSKFFIEWCCKAEFANKQYIDWEEVPSIWDEINKEENKTIKDMYTYLAFHEHNKHNVGLSKDELCEKLNITKTTALAIKRRSSMIAKALLPNTTENKVKELFKF